MNQNQLAVVANNTVASATTQRRITNLLKHFVLSKPFLLSFEHGPLRVVVGSTTPSSQQQNLESTSDSPSNHESTKENNHHIDKNSSSQYFRPISNTEEEFLLIQQLIRHEKYEEARGRLFNLLPFLPIDLHLNTVEESQMRKAYRMMALTFYNNQEYEKALPWFYKAAQLSKHPNDWFNVATCAAQIQPAKQEGKSAPSSDTKEKQPDTSSMIDLAVKSFDRVESLHKERQFQFTPSSRTSQDNPFEQRQHQHQQHPQHAHHDSQAVSYWIQLYWFIISLMNGHHYQQAITFLSKLTNAYSRTRFTDQDYLREIGLPNFEDYLLLCITLFQKVNQQHKCIEFLEQFKNTVDQSGKLLINSMIKKHFPEQSTATTSKIEEIIEQVSSTNSTPNNQHQQHYENEHSDSAESR